ncbi:MAG: hypothetical protein OER21_16420 [Gemmatimonadota bacterium]|nr:hypothetical protein [Gemmatimonadota bacterium]
MSLTPKLLTAALATALAFPGAAGAQGDPDHAVAGGGSLPAGWRARTERDAPLTNVKFVAMDNGYHVTLGPATIFWRDADTASGNYHAVATFAQTRAPQHPEAYGLLIGGRHLADSAQSYTYFIIRTVADRSEFSIRRRAGYAVRPTAVVDWTAHAAIKPVDAAGKTTNELSVLVADGKATFYVNGAEVFSASAADIDTNGVVGYRVNHNLDVHLSAIGVHGR